MSKTPKPEAPPLLVALAWLYFAALAGSVYDLVVNLLPNHASAEPGLALRVRLVQVGLGICVAAGLVVRMRCPSLTSLSRGFQFRLWVYFIAVGALLPSLLTFAGWMTPESTWAGSVCASGVLLGWAAWFVALRLLPSRVVDHASLRTLDLAAFYALTLLLLAEGALFTLQRIAPSPLLWDDSSAAAMVEQLRGNDLTEFLRYNSRGYPDEEFFTRGPNDYVVAVVADSFGVGSVPYHYNFATVAERLLQERLRSEYERVAVDNYGIIIIGMPEYLHLLSTEVLPADPDQVVLAIFVGNDVGGLRADRSRDRFRVQEWLVAQTARRLVRIGTGLESIGPRWPVGVETASEPAFLHDSSLEQPYFTRQAFLKLERERLEICNTRRLVMERSYEDFFEALDLARRWVGPKLLVMLIPDEFQVNDALYAELRPAPGSYDRDLPQKRIVAWAREHGVRVLDLLPVLRQAERQGRTYHLRDTHWNTRGNRVAGMALSEALVPVAE